MIDFLSELYASISDKEVLSFLDDYKSTTTKTDDERLLEEL